jgi:uncharacterized Zn finger protein (UPF0148 family)
MTLKQAAARRSTCCEAPTYRDEFDGRTCCTICDHEQDWSVRYDDDEVDRRFDAAQDKGAT